MAAITFTEPPKNPHKLITAFKSISFPVTGRKQSKELLVKTK